METGSTTAGKRQKRPGLIRGERSQKDTGLTFSCRTTAEVNRQNRGWDLLQVSNLSSSPSSSLSNALTPTSDRAQISDAAALVVVVGPELQNLLWCRGENQKCKNSLISVVPLLCIEIKA